MLNFLKRNLSNCLAQVKASVNISHWLIPKWNSYAAAVWDPYYQTDIQRLEKVQRRAARWVSNDYSSYSSVTSMLDHLRWPTLQKRHKISRLQILFQAIHHEYTLMIPSYYLPMERFTRQYHPQHFILPNSSTTAYQNSYFSRTINEWNDLPTELMILTCF